MTVICQLIAIIFQQSLSIICDMWPLRLLCVPFLAIVVDQLSATFFVDCQWSTSSEHCLGMFVDYFF